MRVSLRSNWRNAIAMPAEPWPLLVFARAPVAGEVKTRLIPALGAQQATELHRRLVLGTLRRACAARAARVQLWIAGDPGHAFVRACARRFRVPLFEQRGVAVQVTGLGSLFNLHFTADEIVDYRTSRSGANEQSRAAMLELMNEGFFLAPRGMGCISTPMGEAEVDALVDAVGKAISD